MRRHLLAALLIVGFGIGVATVAAQTPAEMTYDAFMQLARDGRRRIPTFNTLTPANRAAIVREHVTRWRAVHAARLSPEQQQFIEDAFSLVTPDAYDATQPGREQRMTQMKALEARMATLFSREDARQSFTIHGDYIPAPKM